MRNFEGFITAYREPTDYQPHDSNRCPACQSKRDEKGQEGIAGLWAGDQLSIVPEGFEQAHHRPRDFQKNSCSRANFSSLMHKAKEGTFLEFPKAFPGLFATLLRLQHIFVCEFWDNFKTGKA